MPAGDATRPLSRTPRTRAPALPGRRVRPTPSPSPARARGPPRSTGPVPPARGTPSRRGSRGGRHPRARLRLPARARPPAAVKPRARAQASWPAPMKPTLMATGTRPAPPGSRRRTQDAEVSPRQPRAPEAGPRPRHTASGRAPGTASHRLPGRGAAEPHGAPPRPAATNQSAAGSSGGRTNPRPGALEDRPIRGRELGPRARPRARDWRWGPLARCPAAGAPPSQPTVTRTALHPAGGAGAGGWGRGPGRGPLVPYLARAVSRPGGPGRSRPAGTSGVPAGSPPGLRGWPRERPRGPPNLCGS